MEGGDTWYYDNQTPVHGMFNINGTSDGSSDLGTILGQTGTFTEGMSFNYSGENSWIDHVEPVAPAEMIFENQLPNYGTAIAYDAGSYKTIGASHEFGGLDDGTSPSTKEELMIAYLDFLGITQTLQASFASNTTNTCIEEIIEYYDMSTGGAINWEWEFEGGSPATSTNQNPQVVYFNPGTFDVTLTVSDGVEFSTMTLEDYITVVDSPEIPGIPDGDDEVATNYTTSSEYVTTGANYADTYIWEISPAEAGNISGDGTTGTVEWTPWWTGTANITVKGVNEECGEGEFSDSYEVTCYLATGINELGDWAGIRIYPNPSTGQFSVKFDYNIGATQVTVSNLLGEIIFDEITETVDGRLLNIDLSEYQEGIYFVKLKTDSSEQVKKIIVQ
jgi:PKD repeat protein